MVNQQLLDWVKEQSQQGVSEDEIKNSLLGKGWRVSDVEEVLKVLQNQTKPKKGLKISFSFKLRKRYIILIPLTVIASLFFPSLLNLFTSDIEVISDSDIRLGIVVVPDEENAFFDLEKLEGNLYLPEDKKQLVLDMVSGKTWDDRVASEIVEKNEEAYAIFTEAAQRQRFQDPETADPSNITPNTVLPKMNSWRSMAHLSSLKAMQLAREGNDEKAIEEAMKAVEIGQKIHESQAVLVGHLVASEMKRIGLQTLSIIIEASKLSSEDLVKYALSLDSYYKNEEGLVNSLKADYHFYSYVLDSLSNGDPEKFEEYVEYIGNTSDSFISYGLNEFYYFRPNETKLLFADLTRERINNFNQNCTGTVKVATPEDSRFKLIFTENAIGKILFKVISESSNDLATIKCEGDLIVASTQTLFAIKAYQKVNNNYPTSLNELVPGYLPSVPIDPFDGKSLKYSVSKKIIYSVGRDSQDSGGSTGGEWKDQPDPTFEIKF
jgi:hypothetical protein